VGITESTIDTSSSADQTTIGNGEGTLGDDIVWMHARVAK
jgi:hypothetical protein